MWALALLAAVVGGGVVQAFATSRQQRAFLADLERLKGYGRVAVGTAGRRYLGGKVYVALAADPGGVVTGALVLRGFTTFARARDLPVLLGHRVSRLSGESDVPGVAPAERLAAAVAATALKTALKTARKEARTEATTP